MERTIKIEKKDSHIKYVFNENEKKEIAAEMAQAISEKESLEQKKKEVTSQITAEINAAQSRVSTLSTNYSQGYTFKNHPCEIHFDYEKKRVFTYREDTRELVNDRAMYADEFQQEIFDSHNITAPVEEDGTDVDQVEALEDETEKVEA